ncbi:MAG: hypothetical protein H0V51_16050 [Chloroflexi bacterium]|nr:hypothetical protein [Chloroflexota bacterium]
MRTDTHSAEGITATRLVNARDITIKCYLEPWGEEFEMPPGAIFRVVARGPQGDGLEVTIADEQITVWGWPGSVVRLFHDGVELGAGEWERTPVPPMPPLEEASAASERLARSS